MSETEARLHYSIDDLMSLRYRECSEEDACRKPNIGCLVNFCGKQLKALREGQSEKQKSKPNSNNLCPKHAQSYGQQLHTCEMHDQVKSHSNEGMVSQQPSSFLSKSVSVFDAKNELIGQQPKNSNMPQQSESSSVYHTFVKSLRDRSSESRENDANRLDQVARLDNSTLANPPFTPSDRSQFEPIIINPNCRVHSLLAKNLSLGFVPSAVTKRMSTNNQVSEEYRPLDPWANMRLKANSQFLDSSQYHDHKFMNCSKHSSFQPAFENNYDSTLIDDYCPHAEPLRHPAEFSGETDPKVQMILKKLGTKDNSRDIHRCAHHHIHGNLYRNQTHFPVKIGSFNSDLHTSGRSYRC